MCLSLLYFFNCTNFAIFLARHDRRSCSSCFCQRLVASVYGDIMMFFVVHVVCVCVSHVVSAASAPCSSFAPWQIIINFPLAMTTNISVWHVWKYLFAMRATTLYRVLLYRYMYVCVCLVTISWHACTHTHTAYTTTCCVATVATRLQAQFIELAN